jgi:hypothetical protein
VGYLKAVDSVYEFRCPVCDRLIHEGDSIVFLPDDEYWVHEKCGEDEGHETY